MANRDLLKEAIADAKAVKETAIANAKAALEETFSPMLREKLAAKIAEMDKEDEVDLKEADMEEGLDEAEVEEGKTKSLDDYGKVRTVNDYSDDHAKSGKMARIAKTGTDDGGETELDEVDLDELLRELDELSEEGFGKFSSDGTEGFDGGDGDTQEKALDEALDEAEGEEKGEEGEEEEIDIENMSEDDLKSFIEGVIADMVAAGELEGGEEMESEEGEEEGGESEEGEKEMEMPMEEEDIYEVKKMKKEVEEAKKAKEKAEKELKEAFDALEAIKTELNEVNLLNAKLLYTNKVFKAKNLTESQKVKVLEAFDKAASVKEAKLVYETLSAGFIEKKAPMNESLIRGGASKTTGIVEKKPIMEANDQVLRMQKLAGIIK